MDLVNQTVLRALAQVRDVPAVSIYMPMELHGADHDRNIVRFRNQLRKVEALLESDELPRGSADRALASAKRLLDDATFWDSPAPGLAVLSTAQQNWVFRIPVAFRELVHVGEVFRIAPLLYAAAATARFLVLALSENQAKLVDVAGQSIRQVNVPELPAGLEAALHLDEPEAQLHLRSTARFPNRKQGAVFHGQAATTYEKADLETYCRAVDKALSKTLQQSELPLLVVAAEPTSVTYLDVNTYSRTVPEPIQGNPDHWTDSELLGRALAAFDSHVAKEDQAEISRFGELIGAGLAASEPDALLRAACRGQINELLIAEGALVRGRFDRATEAVHLAPRDASDADDLVELAVHETLAHGGMARYVKSQLLPADKPMLAQFRYSVEQVVT